MLKKLAVFQAAAVLIGGIIGAGIFGVPFVFAKSGWLVALIFLVVLTAVNLLLNLGYGEVILRTGRAHQIVGYAGIYLGSNFKKLALFTTVLSIYTALLAYIILGGQFLFNLTAFHFSWSPESMTVLFFAVAALITWRGLRLIAKVDLWMVLFYLVVVGILIFLGLPSWQPSNLVTVDWYFWFLPYGVLWFALSGMSAVALQREVLEGQENKLRPAIVLGTLVPALIYLLFALLVAGVSGEVTSDEVFSGLAASLGTPVLVLGSLFGLAAVFTSFLGLGRILMETFQLDFRLRKASAWCLALLPPFVFFFLGVRNFIEIIGFAGAVALGINAVIFILIYRKVKSAGHRVPEYTLRLPGWVWQLTLAFSLGGVIYELVQKLGAN